MMNFHIKTIKASKFSPVNKEILFLGLEMIVL